MKRFLILFLCFLILSIGCSARQSTFKKAYNTLAVVQSGYNAAGPVLESANIPDSKKPTVNAIDKKIHDLIEAGWYTLIAFKEKQATADQVTATFHALLAGLNEYATTVDNATFTKTIRAITIVLELYLNIHPQDAKLLQPTMQSLQQMAAAH